MFKGKTLLITGGTGTFGNAVLKRHTGEIALVEKGQGEDDQGRRRQQRHEKPPAGSHTGGAENLGG